MTRGEALFAALWRGDDVLSCPIRCIQTPSCSVISLLDTLHLLHSDAKRFSIHTMLGVFILGWIRDVR
jgi:hypothetical protein